MYNQSGEKRAYMRVRIGKKILGLIEGDITRQKTGAIVNAANSGLRGGGGVDGAIHRSGGPEIMAECRKLRSCPTGSARVTTAGKLPAQYVIHAVGPIWRGGGDNEAALLRGAYQRSLEIADEKGLKSISFPSISTGAYGYPLDEAAEIALHTAVEYLHGGTSLEEVTFVLFNERVFNAYKYRLEMMPFSSG